MRLFIIKTTAYLRISTIDQEIEKNKSDILKLANEKHLGHVEFVEEQISGKVSWKKRKIYPIIQDAQKDDVFIVSELSRLGRSMLEIMEILSIVTEKQIKIASKSLVVYSGLPIRRTNCVMYNQKIEKSQTI
jgi:DNA invertase Pin-like site-specific DNA recombinase